MKKWDFQSKSGTSPKFDAEKRLKIKAIWKSPKMGHAWPSKSGKVDRYDTAYFNVTDCVGNAVLNEPISALCTGIKPSSLIYYIADDKHLALL